MTIRDNLTEHEVWEMLIQYLSEFHDADVNSIAKFVYSDNLHEGTSFYVVDSYDHTQRNKVTLKCYKNDLKIYGEIIHFIDLDKSEKFTINQIIEKLELDPNSDESKFTTMDELNLLDESNPIRVLSHAYMLYEYERSEHLYKLRLNDIDIPNSLHDKYHYDQRNLVDYSNVHHLHPDPCNLSDFIQWLEETNYINSEISIFQNLIENKIFDMNVLIPESIRKIGGLLKPLINENAKICSAVLFSNNIAITHSLLNGAILQSPKLCVESDVKNIITFDLESASLLNSAIPLLKTNIYAGMTLENTLAFTAKMISSNQEVILIIPDIYSRPDVRIINTLFDFLFSNHSEQFSILLLDHKSSQKYAIKPGNFAFTLYDAFSNYGIESCLDMFYNAIDISLENKHCHLDNLSSFSKHHLNVKQTFNLSFPKTKIEQSLNQTDHCEVSEAQTISVLSNNALDPSTINWLEQYESSEEKKRLNHFSSAHLELTRD